MSPNVEFTSKDFRDSAIPVSQLNLLALLVLVFEFAVLNNLLDLLNFRSLKIYCLVSVFRLLLGVPITIFRYVVM